MEGEDFNEINFNAKMSLYFTLFHSILFYSTLDLLRTAPPHTKKTQIEAP